MSFASSLQPWQFNTKITSEKIRFKAGSSPRMINKEWLAQFIYKPTKSTEKLAIENGHEKFGHDKIGNLILLFQIVNYHPVLSNNCNNVFLQC